MNWMEREENYIKTVSTSMLRKEERRFSVWMRTILDGHKEHNAPLKIQSAASRARELPDNGKKVVRVKEIVNSAESTNFILSLLLLRATNYCSNLQNSNKYADWCNDGINAAVRVH